MFGQGFDSLQLHKYYLRKEVNMKSLYQVIQESVSTAKDFREDIGVPVSGKIKFKNGYGEGVLACKAYSNYYGNRPGLKDLLIKKYGGDKDQISFLGSYLDETGRYSLNGGETLEGSSIQYDDYLITTDNNNNYLLHSAEGDKRTLVSFTLVDSNYINNAAISRLKKAEEKLQKLFPYGTTGKEEDAKFFKRVNDKLSTADFEGLNGKKDIHAEIAYDEDSGDWIVSVDGKQLKASRDRETVVDLIGHGELESRILQVIVEQYRDAIKTEKI